VGVSVVLPPGYQGAGLVVLSPEEYEFSSGSCIFGKRSLLFQICGIKSTS